MRHNRASANPKRTRDRFIIVVLLITDMDYFDQPYHTFSVKSQPKALCCDHFFVDNYIPSRDYLVNLSAKASADSTTASIRALAVMVSPTMKTFSNDVLWPSGPVLDSTPRTMPSLRRVRS